MSAIQLTVRPDAVAVLTFDQPGSRANVLTADLWTEFESVLDSLAVRSDLKGLVLASAKPGIFIAGADLKLLANAPGPNDPAVRGFIEQGLRVLEKLEALPFPTCAAIDGAALGGGLEVALACDFRVCGTSEKVKLGLPEVTLGLIPGWGGTQRLPRLIGIENALEVLLCNVSYGLATAVERGLAMTVLRSEELVEQAGSRARALSELRIWEGWRAEKRGPIPSEPYADPDDLLKPGALNRAQWNRMFLEPVFFDTHRDYVRTQMVDSLNRNASVAVIDVLENGATLPLKAAIAVETEAFMRLAGSDESKRLIAEFFASRKK